MNTSLPTVILFGSAARGDNDELSDIDILIIENSTYPKSLREGKVEIHKISREEAINKAQSGDLFMIHILFEGVVISDPSSYIQELREELKIKKSYYLEKEEALTLASFIALNWEDFLDFRLLNKRIAWCVRTVAISNLVESGRLVFSPSGICRSVAEVDVTDLIELRRSLESPEASIPKLKQFIEANGAESYLSLSRDEQVLKIQSFGKSVALSTYLGMQSNSCEREYSC